MLVNLAADATNASAALSFRFRDALFSHGGSMVKSGSAH
jgi:hypothetical protein